MYHKVVTQKNTLTFQQLAKLNRVFLSCYRHEMYRVDAVGLSIVNYTFKKQDFCEYVKFGAILPITS